MLYRLVRPVRRSGSRFPYFQQRIPADVKGQAVGLTLDLPIGVETVRVTITPKASTVRFRCEPPILPKRRRVKLSWRPIWKPFGGPCARIRRCRSKAIPATKSLALKALPIGLAHNVKLKRAVARDTVVSFDDVDLRHDLDVVALRQEMERSASDALRKPGN